MKLVDQFSDKHNAMLMDIASKQPDVVGRVKEAGTVQPDNLDDHHYAFPEARKFPIYNEKQAQLSRLYAEEQKDEVPDEVMERINKRLKVSDYDPSKFQSTEKTADTTDNLDHYLLPQKQRLFVGSEEDVKEASRALLENEQRLKTSSLNEASKRLVKKARKYGIDSEDLPLEVYKYAGMTDCDAGKLLDSIEARAQACKTLEDRKTFDKLASVVKRKFPDTGVIEDKRELSKIASALKDADEEAGLEKEYNIRLKDPMKTVFNREKLSSGKVQLGQLSLRPSQIKKIPAEKFEEILGRQFGMSSQDPEFIPLLKSLPDDMKEVLGRELRDEIR